MNYQVVLISSHMSFLNPTLSKQLIDQYAKEEMDECFEDEFQYVRPTPNKDMLSSMAYNTHTMLVSVLDELDSQGKLDFILLKNQSIAEFWAHVQKNRRREKLHASALEKMRSSFTAEELSILGIKLPNDLT